MPIPLKNEKRKYTRLQHTEDEKRYLKLRGFQPVVSSNVSAVGRDAEKLIIRFHGGSTYVYPESGDEYNSIMNAPSKGKWVWRELRRKRMPYYKVGSYNIPDDVEDRDIMRPQKQDRSEALTIGAALAGIVALDEIDFASMLLAET